MHVGAFICGVTGFVACAQNGAGAGAGAKWWVPPLDRNHRKPEPSTIEGRRRGTEICAMGDVGTVGDGAERTLGLELFWKRSLLSWPLPLVPHLCRRRVPGFKVQGRFCVFAFVKFFILTTAQTREGGNTLDARHAKKWRRVHPPRTLTALAASTQWLTSSLVCTSR